MRLILFGIILVTIVGGVGYALGRFLQFPEETLAAFASTAPSEDTAPLPVSPADGSEFVDSDIQLRWTWTQDLGENQLFALRVWAQDLPFQEVWTADSSHRAQQIIDSFSIDYGRFYWQVAVVNLADGSFASLASRWSEVAQLQRLRRARIPARAYEDMSAAARQFADLDLSDSELIDAIHLFIHKNSKTNEQLSYAPDYRDAIELMLAYSRGESTKLPRLLCDGRSTAMLTLLNELGIESRLVFLYQDGRGWISQHTVLEVFNPDSQYWQVHDLASDVYYIAAGSGIRVNAESILFDSKTEFWGCPVGGGPCSAEHAGFGLPYFEALRYGHTFDVWVNPDRFDLSARFAGHENRNLAEFIGKGDPQPVTFRLAS